MSNDLRSWFVTFPNGMIPLVEIGGVTSDSDPSEASAAASQADALISLGLPGPYWALLGLIGPYWALLAYCDSIGPT
ncbi:hypothetical protein E3N88_42674 [Mikania micrantha]|uniref:Uncharacterized protein n=1 Tax=Mikania micrantha TaxID=192012 RepID=A0A5N6LHZ6_9ASTR|nr:hypothetical protein E3N88_42674 [Mikania micrantha]